MPRSSPTSFAVSGGWGELTMSAGSRRRRWVSGRRTRAAGSTLRRTPYPPRRLRRPRHDRPSSDSDASALDARTSATASANESPLEHSTQLSPLPRLWSVCSISGCLLTFTDRVVAAFIVLNLMEHRPRGVILGVIDEVLMGLMARITETSLASFQGTRHFRRLHPQH